MSKGNDEKKPDVKRLLLAAAIAMSFSAAAILGTSATFSLLSSATATQSNTFAAGTVTLTNDISGACAVSNMLPGASPAPCALKATYGGSVPAYMAVDVLIETQSGNGGTNLYNPSDSAHDLQIALSSTSPSVTYTVPVTSTPCPGSAPSGSNCYELDNEIVSLTPFTNASAPVAFSTAVTFPASTTSGYRGGAAQVILTAHAVQSGNNSASGCTPGVVCSTVRWS